MKPSWVRQDDALSPKDGPLLSLCLGPVTLGEKFHFSSVVEENLGMGGSEHYFLVLAHRLSLVLSSVKVSVLVSGRLPDLSGYSNPNLDFVLEDKGISISSWDMGIFGTGYLAQISNWKDLPRRVVAVSHHPHDGNLRRIRRQDQIHAIVNLGRYQHLSNRFGSRLAFRVPSYFMGPTSNQPATNHIQNPIIGHISSLHPSKGFHILAKLWRRISKLAPTAKLEVVGGISLYGEKETHPILPTTRAYGEKLTRILGQEAIRDQVRFFGRVQGSIAPIAGRWAVAVMNPSGIGEADPAVLRDMIRLGVPAVSTRRYGMSEYMDFFPETTVKSARDIPKVLSTLLDSRELRESIRGKSIELSKKLLERNGQIDLVWKEILLLNKVEILEGFSVYSRQFEPIGPNFRESLILLRNRIWWRLFQTLEAMRARVLSAFE